MVDSQFPDVSVVLCVRNGAATIRAQLDTLDAQADAPAFEVVLVDNGSTDGTTALLHEWASGTEHAAAQIHVVDAGTTPGLPRARNRGALAATGRVLAFCDADDEVDPGWVAAMARAIDGDQLAGGRIHAVDSQGNDRPEMFRPGLIGTPYLPHVGGANFAVSRKAYFAVGGFDESLPPYGFDDVDFSWRVQEAGFPLIYVPDAVVRFTVSDAGASLRKKFLLGKGRVLMARRYPDYDSTEYTAAEVLRTLGSTSAAALTSSVRRRSLDRQLAGRVVAAAGRVNGYLAYSALGKMPERKLLTVRDDG